MMKLKHIVTLLLCVFSVYYLCPVLMQGLCGPSVSESPPVVEVSPRPSCSGHCEEGAENTPQRKNHQERSCCAIGLQLTRPSDPSPVSQTLPIAFPLTAAISSHPDASPFYESTFRYFHPAQKLYADFPAHHISFRAPPFFSPDFHA